MSSRVLRKLGLQGEKETTSLADEASDTEADFSSSGGAKKKQLNINRYDLLNQQSHSESEVKEDDDHETAGSLNAQENAAESKDAGRRKKKKKRKKPGKIPSNARSSEDNIEDEVERSVREVNELLGDSGTAVGSRTGTTSTAGSVKKGILNIEHRSLNPNNELKRIFGSKIVQNEQSKRRGGTRSRGHIKTTWLVSPKENWPPTGKSGLSMSLVKTENGISTFAFEHSLNYQQVQMNFFTAVESLNPDNIVEAQERMREQVLFMDKLAKSCSTFGLLHQNYADFKRPQKTETLILVINKCKAAMKLVKGISDNSLLRPEINITPSIINSHPYHVDALLQLSELCRLSEDLPMAAELIERALYCLECAFHPSFNFAQGNCRLDYRKQENRALFIAVFKHLMFVGARACYRTALEFCKLLLSLDPEGDPLGVLLAVDFYALRAQKYEWLIKLASEWEPSRNLSQLPNFAFSVAMAHFQLGQDVELAHHLLQNALIMFPGVLLPLLSKCGVQADSRVASHAFFSTAENSQSPSLSVLVQLYVTRCYHVWKESELLPWLERNVHTVLDRVDHGDSFVTDSESKRAKRYPTLPRNIHRHIILADFKDVTFSEVSQGPVLSFDPLPPSDSINLYNRPTRLRFYANANAFSMFFRSLMPNFNANQPASDEPEGNAEGQGDGEGGGAAVDLQRSVTSLLDAMRDLLSNIHMPDGPAEGDIDSDEDRP